MTGHASITDSDDEAVDDDTNHIHVKHGDWMSMTTSSSPRSRGRDERNESLEPHTRVQLIDSIARALPCLLQMGMLLDAEPPLRLVVHY
jgi:hypothetical protein